MGAAVLLHGALTRLLGLALRLLAAGNLLYLGLFLALDVLHGTDRAPPMAVALGLLVFTALPRAGAWLLDRAARGHARVEGEALVLAAGRRQVAVPLASIAELRPWRCPLPAPGLTLILGSGKRVRCAGDLPGLVDALARVVPAAHGLGGHPMVAFARARPGRWRLWRSLLGLGLWPLGSAAVIFRLDQIIRYGGPLGQYRAEGLGPYLEAFLARWVAVGSACAVTLGVLLVLGELAIYGATWFRPARARTLRVGLEGGAHLLYFAGVPGLLAYLLLLA